MYAREEVVMAGADMLPVLQSHRSGDHSAPIPTLRNEPVVPQHINHQNLEGAGGQEWSEPSLCRWVSGPEAGDAGNNDVEGLCRVVGGIGERLDELPSFKEGSRPALYEEKRNSIGTRGGLMRVVEDLRAIVRNIDLHLELVEVGVNAGLLEDQRRNVGRGEEKGTSSALQSKPLAQYSASLFTSLTLAP